MAVQNGVSRQLLQILEGMEGFGSLGLVVHPQAMESGLGHGRGRACDGSSSAYLERRCGDTTSWEALGDLRIIVRV